MSRMFTVTGGPKFVWDYPLIRKRDFFIAVKIDI